MAYYMVNTSQVVLDESTSIGHRTERGNSIWHGVEQPLTDQGLSLCFFIFYRRKRDLCEFDSHYNSVAQKI